MFKKSVYIDLCKFYALNSRIFLGMIWGQKWPFPIQKLAKTSQKCVYHFQFSSSKFWSKFHENLIENAKATDAWICIK